MKTQSLILVPAWLTRLNHHRKLASSGCIFDSYDYKKACFYHIAAMRLVSARIEFISSAPATPCAFALSAQPVVTSFPRRQAGFLSNFSAVCNVIGLFGIMLLPLSVLAFYSILSFLG